MTMADDVTDPRDQAPDAFLAWARRNDLHDEHARRALAAVIGHGVHDPALWGRRYQVPRRMTDRWRNLPRLVLDRSVVSSVDRFQKLLFRTQDGLNVETVLIPLHKAGRVSVCLSSQVGCAMACAFCATARMSTRRTLATWEILDQFLQARDIARSQGRTVTGAVFMGMGEPFLPAVKPRVLDAAALLSCPYGAAIAAKAITISTVGIVPSIDEYTEEGHKYRLSISLGAATDEKRARLVPVAARWPLAELIASARRYALARRVRANLSYVCISGENVGEEDARALGDLIGDTPVRLDLIDVTDPTGRFHPPTPDELRCVPGCLDPPRRSTGRATLFGRGRHSGGLRYPCRKWVIGPLDGPLGCRSWP